MSSKNIVKGSVALLVPAAGQIEPRAFQHAIAMTAAACVNGNTVTQVGVSERTLVHTSRNFLAKGFLESDCEWGFWMDTDMVLEARTIPTMIKWAQKLDAKFLTGVYYQRLAKHMPLILIRKPDKQYKDEYMHDAVVPVDERPIKVHACGFGCVLTHRDVFEKLEYPYFRYIVEKGREVSEDFYFCVQAKKAGIQLWAIPELKCGHLGLSPIIGRESVEIKGEIQKINLNNL